MAVAVPVASGVYDGAAVAVAGTVCVAVGVGVGGGVGVGDGVYVAVGVGVMVRVGVAVARGPQHTKALRVQSTPRPATLPFSACPQESRAQFSVWGLTRCIDDLGRSRPRMDGW